jgi:8-oxo-dGTP pyrophosphatase MutT (NUDIX family)
MYSGVILKYRNKCLLCKRSEKYSHPNQWFIPTGKIERGETPREAAIRELYEETDFELFEQDLDFIGTIPVIEDGVKSDQDFIYVFISELSNEILPDLESASDGHEHTKCGYFTFEETKKLGLDPNLREIVKKYFYAS